jgi:hypothetical protein
MKKSILKLLSFLLAALILLALTSCGKTDTGGEENNGGDTGGSDTVPPSEEEKLSLIENRIANFKIVTTKAMGSGTVKAANNFAKALRELGVTVDNPIRASGGGVTDCEIIIG